MSIITQNAALQGLLAAHLPALAEYEGLTPEAITSAIEAGTMVLLGNPNHANVKPILVGQPSRVKVNANIGTSPFQNHPGCEMRKLEVAQEAGADTVMDLSIAGDLVAIRKDMLSRTPLPLGTVPLYSVAQRYIDRDRDPADIDPEELFAEVEMQAEQGVDFMTLHCGLTRRGAEWAARGERALGIVSRGGSILARWMLKNDKENPLLTGYDRLLELADQALNDLNIHHIVGIIATGNYFVDDPKKVEQVIRETGADAVEMEGAAVAHIAARNDLPVLVIRALSDNADTDYVEFKEFDISEYADTAAKIAVNIVKCM